MAYLPIISPAVRIYFYRHSNMYRKSSNFNL